jgi:dihydrolipoamide dehydrogenase
VSAQEIRVPDIGDFGEVPVIEVLVSVGDTVAVEDPLITLESDKATMDVPAPAAGKITAISVKVGDNVAQGAQILTLEVEGASESSENAAVLEAPGSATPPQQSDNDFQVVVIGSGPGGYSAAFRAADLGLKTALIERYEQLGGVCLNVGCIPSKALLHAAKVIAEAEDLGAHGVSFGKPDIDLGKLVAFKEDVVGRLTGGVAGMAKQRKVEVIHGEAKLTGVDSLSVGDRTVTFDNCIIATGSSPAKLPFIPDDERVIDSTGALSPADVPKRLLVLGGGIIGLEMATVYHALGAKVTVVEMQSQLIPGCDPDLVKPLHKRIEPLFEAILLDTQVTAVKSQKNGLRVEFSKGDAKVFDRILVAVGRTPNGRLIGADAAGVKVDERGFIPVDRQQRTNVPNIYAIGDIVGQPMLAHKATHEAHVAAEVIAGLDGGTVEFDPAAIPSVAYTDPEVAWMGLTETAAKANGIKYEKAVFPWVASGRALGLDRPDGFTKLLYDPESQRLLGAGVVGVNAGDLIAETVHAMEMGANMEDMALTVHPHPTLSESIGLAAELAAGTITDLPQRKRR